MPATARKIQGTYRLAGHGRRRHYTYTRDNGEPLNGSTDTFTYTLTDGDGDTTTATLTIDITDGADSRPRTPTDTGDDTTVRRGRSPGHARRNVLPAATARVAFNSAMATSPQRAVTAVNNRLVDGNRTTECRHRDHLHRRLAPLNVTGVTGDRQVHLQHVLVDYQNPVRPTARTASMTAVIVTDNDGDDRERHAQRQHRRRRPERDERHRHGRPSNTRRQRVNVLTRTTCGADTCDVVRDRRSRPTSPRSTLPANIATPAAAARRVSPARSAR